VCKWCSTLKEWRSTLKEWRPTLGGWRRALTPLGLTNFRVPDSSEVAPGILDLYKSLTCVFQMALDDSVVPPDVVSVNNIDSTELGHPISQFRLV